MAHLGEEPQGQAPEQLDLMLIHPIWLAWILDPLSYLRLASACPISFSQQAPTDNTDKKVVRVKIKSRPVVSNSILSRNIDRFFLIPLSSFSIVLFHRDVYIYIESVQ